MSNKKTLTHILNLFILFSIIYLFLSNSISFFIFLPFLLIYLFIWKLLFGLAWHNYLILLGFCSLLNLFFFVFALTPLTYIFLALVFNVLFIFKTLVLKEKDIYMYALTKNIFLSFIVFLTSLSFYSLYYIYNTSIIIAFGSLVLSYFPLLYLKELIDKTILKRSEKLLFIFTFSQLSFLLFFSTSNLLFFPNFKHNLICLLI